MQARTRGFTQHFEAVGIGRKCATLSKKRPFERNLFNRPLFDVDQRTIACCRITLARGGHGNQRILKLSRPVCASSLRVLMGAWSALNAARAGAPYTFV
jgi:hypothetical protein